MVCRALRIIGIAALAVTGYRLDQFLRFHVISTDRSASLMIHLAFSLLYAFYLSCICICQSVTAQFGIIRMGNELKEGDSVFGKTLNQIAGHRDFDPLAVTNADDSQVQQLRSTENEIEIFLNDYKDNGSEIAERAKENGLASAEDLEAFEAELKDGFTERKDAIMAEVRADPKELEAFAVKMSASMSKMLDAFEEGPFVKKMTDVLDDLERIVNRWA
eukprot:scaffold40988_cov52-Attheya_sp.AAC.7